ncbi:MAG: hypothetical protein ABJE47_07455 [bacterium]
MRAQPFGSWATAIERMITLAGYERPTVALEVRRDVTAAFRWFRDVLRLRVFARHSASNLVAVVVM